MILGFDTSAAHVGAALMRDGAVLASAHEEMARGQAERLVPLLEELLAGAGVGWRDLEAIGVGIGPGNFTGIRLSVSAARGLALGLQIPAVGVSLLEAVAYGTDTPVLAALSAPRGSAYVMGHGMAVPVAARQIAIGDIPQSWREPDLRCIGSAAAEIADLLGAELRPAAHAPASAIARIAATRWQDAPARPAPLYLRAADAAPSRDAPPVILDDA